MKTRMKPPGKKLRTNAARAADNDCFEEESSMRLSRAFVVVLILHVVAVGGILLFNSMKARHEVTSPTAYLADKPSKASAAIDATGGTADRMSTTGTNDAGRVHIVTAQDTLNKLASTYGVTVGEITAANGILRQSDLRIGQRLVIPPPGAAAPVPRLTEVRQVATTRKAAAVATASVEPQAAASMPEPIPSSGTYTVVKGDNPVAIARKFGINYEELLKLNAIEDPKLLQIGQVLKLPEKK